MNNKKILYAFMAVNAILYVAYFGATKTPNEDMHAIGYSILAGVHFMCLTATILYFINKKDKL